ncbi:hypothetical protein Syun_024051 [Stephania yunnanensis]|uniref:Uncharacterized protein n=1 Tax=Stephania yunnanensis TaxID=152371 RepID=A0AAP0FA27_9MAGN
MDSELEFMCFDISILRLDSLKAFEVFPLFPFWWVGLDAIHHPSRRSVWILTWSPFTYTLSGYLLLHVLVGIHSEQQVFDEIALVENAPRTIRGLAAIVKTNALLELINQHCTSTSVKVMQHRTPCVTYAPRGGGRSMDSGENQTSRTKGTWTQKTASYQKEKQKLEMNANAPKASTRARKGVLEDEGSHIAEHRERDLMIA